MGGCRGGGWGRGRGGVRVTSQNKSILKGNVACTAVKSNQIFQDSLVKVVYRKQCDTFIQQYIESNARLSYTIVQ